MNTTNMNKRINFITAVEVMNEVGDIILEPTVFKTVWASVNPVSGKDYFEAKKYQAELIYKIIVRYTEGITPDMQIQFKDRIFLIRDIMNYFEKNEMLKINGYREGG